MDTPTPLSEDEVSAAKEWRHPLRDVSPAAIEAAIGETLTRLTGVDHKVELASLRFRPGSLGMMPTDVRLVITAETYGPEGSGDRRVVVFLPPLERRDLERPPDEAPTAAPLVVLPEGE